MSGTPEENYLILSTTDPTTTYHVENISIRDNVYTMDEIDAIIRRFSSDLKSLIDDCIILSNPDNIPNAERTSLWMEIKDTDNISDFSDWYHHNTTIG